MSKNEEKNRRQGHYLARTLGAVASAAGIIASAGGLAVLLYIGFRGMLFETGYLPFAAALAFPAGLLLMLAGSSAGRGGRRDEQETGGTAAERLYEFMSNTHLAILLLIIAAAAGVWGYLNFGHMEPVLRTEIPEWQAWQADLPEGSYTSLNVKEAEPYLFLQTSEDASVGTGVNKYRYTLYTLYGLIRCRDDSGRTVFCMKKQIIDEMTDLHSEFDWRLDFRESVLALAGSLIDTEVYGTVEALPENAELDYSYYMSGMPGLLHGEDSGGQAQELEAATSRRAELENRLAVIPFEEGKPDTVMVEDGERYAGDRGQGAVCLAAAAALLLFWYGLMSIRRASGARN